MTSALAEPGIGGFLATCLLFVLVLIAAAVAIRLWLAHLSKRGPTGVGGHHTTVYTTETLDRSETDIDLNAGQILLEDLVKEGLATGSDLTTLAALEHFEFNSLMTDGRQQYIIRNTQTGQTRTYANLHEIPATLRVLFEAH